MSKCLLTRIIQEDVPMDEKGCAMIAIASKSRKQHNKDVKSGKVWVEESNVPGKFNLYMKMTRKQWAKKDKADKKRIQKELAQLATRQL